MELVTIPISHYCEKVRWTLDRWQIPYRELPHMPPFHKFATSGGSVPVLIDGETVITDSADILHYLDRRLEGALYPTSDGELIAELEPLFDRTLGVATRRWGYSRIVNNRQAIYPRWTKGVPAWQPPFFPLAYPLVRRILTKTLQIDDRSATEGYNETMGVFDRVSEILADGRPYLLGDRLSALDITFAALAAPIVAPPQHPVPNDLAKSSPETRADIEKMRQTNAGRFVLQLYANERSS
jgi:glutathione S-transferase